LCVATDADHPLPKALRRPWRSARGATCGRPGHGRGRSAGPGEERRPTNWHGCAPRAASRNDYRRIPHHRQSTARPAGQPVLLHCLRQHLPTRGGRPPRPAPSPPTWAGASRSALRPSASNTSGGSTATSPSWAPVPSNATRVSPEAGSAQERCADSEPRSCALHRRVHGHPGDGRPTVVRSDRRGLGSAGRVVARTPTDSWMFYSPVPELPSPAKTGHLRRSRWPNRMAKTAVRLLHFTEASLTMAWIDPAGSCAGLAWSCSARKSR
jgi:hypothetical protein